MKYITVVLALTATTLAAPSAQEKRTDCTFGTYRCSADNYAIDICNISGNWERVGDCPSGTSCEYLPQNGFDLPFCTKNKSASKRAGGDYNYCATPGQYSCLGYNAIQVCNTSNQLEKVGNCPKDSHCGYLNGIPFCVDNVAA